MPEFKDLHIEEGLFNNYFIIKGDQDYLDLCRNLMEKYKEMESNLSIMRQEYSRLLNQLASMESNGHSIYYDRLIGAWSKEKYLEGVKKLNKANRKFQLLKQKEQLLKNYYNQITAKENELVEIVEENKRLKDKNKILTKQLNFIKLKNRNLRIKLILSKTKS